MNYSIIIILLILLISYNLQLGQSVEINYKKTVKSDIIHIFWTGGFDSTFRLCQLLIHEKKIVQPIYIQDINTDGHFLFGSKVKRKNKDLEIKTMNKIRIYLNNKYSYTKKNLLRTKYVNKISIDKNYIIAMRNLYFQNFGVLAPLLNQFFGFFSRPYNQYTTLALFTKNYPFACEIGVEKCNSGLDLHTKKYRIGKGHNCKLITNKNINFKIFDKFRFSIVHLTKKDMLKISQKNNYDDVLKLTWSCWFPKDGKPCGKCDMCKHRIIE